MALPDHARSKKSTSDASVASILEREAKRDAVASRLLEQLRRGTLEVADLDACEATAPIAMGIARTAEAAVRWAERVVIVFAPDDSASYYSGVCFRVYRAGANAPVARGGRYDRLYETFGEARPAVGFTVSVDALEVAG